MESRLCLFDFSPKLVELFHAVVDLFLGYFNFALHPTVGVGRHISGQTNAVQVQGTISSKPRSTTAGSPTGSHPFGPRCPP